MTNGSLLVLVVGMTLVTYLPRLAPFVLLRRRENPRSLAMNFASIGETSFSGGMASPPVSAASAAA